jgi:hypothetical protein
VLGVKLDYRRASRPEQDCGAIFCNCLARGVVHCTLPSEIKEKPLRLEHNLAGFFALPGSRLFLPGEVIQSLKGKLDRRQDSTS